MPTGLLAKIVSLTEVKVQAKIQRRNLEKFEHGANVLQATKLKLRK